MGRHRRPAVGRHMFTPETMQNSLFEQYYKGQGLVPESEWPELLAALQKDLPITFRVTGFRERNKELLRLIKHRYLNEILSIAEHSRESLETEVQRISFKSLPWYPNDLAWQLDTDRMSLRKNKELKSLHQFLVSETESGNISRQEAVSMLPPLLMDVQSHHSILDLCAAPGSKAAQLLELLHAHAERQRCDLKSYAEPTGVVVANDIEQKRCYIMLHQIKRLQSPCTLITQEDASCFPKLYVPASTKDKELEQFLFDRVLADVPCSGDGTLRKNPDLWLRWTPNLGVSEHFLQLRILRRGLELLRDSVCSHGDPPRLVYSTCSFNPVENEAVVAQLLHACQGAVRLVSLDSLQGVTRAGQNGDPGCFITRPGLTNWRVMDKKGCWYDKFEEVPSNLQAHLRPSLFPPPNAGELHLERCIRVLPHDQNTGGFFIAVLEKLGPLPWLRSSRPTIIHNPTSANADDSTVEQDQKSSAVIANGEKTQSTGAGKRTNPEANSTSAAKKPRVFNESPFNFIDLSSDRDWPQIRDYYGITDHNSDCSAPFHPDRLLTRSTEADSRRRTFYYVNDLVKRIIQTNEPRGVKIVNSGVRLFAMMDDKQFTGFRILQEGVDLADVFLPPSGGRRIHLSSEQYTDLLLLLEQEMPLISRMSEGTQSQWEKLDPGPVLIEYCPDGNSEQVNPKAPPIRLVFAGWRGVRSLRHYIGRHERLHLMRLVGLDPAPPLNDRVTTDSPTDAVLLNSPDRTVESCS